MEQFVYTKKHLEALKTYKITKITIMFLTCLVVLLQSISWLVVWLRDMPVRTSDMWFVGITLVCALYFLFSQVYFIIHNRKITRAVKTQGQFKTMRVKLKFSNKASWAGGFVVLCRIIAIVFIVLLVALIVSFIQNYLNWGKIILKMPLMVLLAVACLNTSAELRYQTMIEKA